MKFLKSFDNFKINELFDSEDLKASNEIDYLSKNIDTKKLSQPKESYSFRLNNLILSKIPFFKYGKPEVHPDMIIYRFGNFESTLVIVIEGYLINTKYDKNAFNVKFYIEKKGKCLNPDEIGDNYNINELLEYLENSVDIIKSEFNIKPPLTLN